MINMRRIFGLNVGARLLRVCESEKWRDLIGSMVSGVLIGGVIGTIRSMGGSGLIFSEFFSLTFVSVGCYMFVSIGLRQIWTGELNRFAPRWLLTALATPPIILGILNVPLAVDTWGSAYQLQPTLAEFLWVRFEDARSAWIVFSIFSLPILTMFHFADHLAHILMVKFSPEPMSSILEDKIEVPNGFRSGPS